MVSYGMITVFLLLGVWIVDGESVMYSLKVEEPNRNGSFCPGKVAFTCTGREAPIVFDWYINGSPNGSYTYEISHTFPRNVTVAESPVIVTITSASGESLINITSTLLGNFSYLNGAVIQCGRNPTRSGSIFVKPYELGAINVSSVQDYGENLMLDKITAVWERLVSMQCRMLSITYEIALKNSSNYTIISVPNDCTMDLCMQEIDVPEPFYEEYFLEITASSNVQGTTSFQRTETIAGRVESVSTSSNFDVKPSRCLESITCVSSISRRCEVRIGRSLSAAMSANSSVNGFINSSISTSLLSFDRRDTIYYVARFEVNDMIVIQIKGNFSDIKVVVKLSGWNTALIIIGVILSVITLPLLSIIIIIALKFSSKWHIKGILHFGIIILSAIVGSIDIILWIVTAAIVAPQENTCDTSWQFQRDALIVADFIISIVCTISVSSIAILLYSYCPKGDPNRSFTNKMAKEIIQSGVDVKEVKYDQFGRATAEFNMTQFHRQVGEKGTATEFQLKTQEKFSKVIKEEQLKESREDEERKAELERREKGGKKKKNMEKEEHHYATTEFAVASTVNPAPSVQVTDHPTDYSKLNRPENNKKNDYHHLQFKNNSCTPKQNPVPDTKGVYSHLNADSSINESGERSTAVAMSSNSSKSKPRKGNQLPPSGQPINSTGTAADKKLKTNIPPKVSLNRISPEQR